MAVVLSICGFQHELVEEMKEVRRLAEEMLEVGSICLANHHSVLKNDGRKKASFSSFKPVL